MSAASLDTDRVHLLTVSLEDYYQGGAFTSLIQPGQFYRFERRLEQNTLHALALLDQFQIKATFFVTGWNAERFPEIVRLVADRGHEIASSCYSHRPIRDMSPAELRDDLARARDILERAGRRKVLGFRSGYQWLAAEDLWVLDMLAAEGYAYDASLCPRFRRFADEPWRRFAHRHTFDAKQLWEFPRPSHKLLGWNFPIAGGNYYRQFPHWLMRRAVARWQRNCTAPFIMYFHVWELDCDQPRITAASFWTRMRHYRNIPKMAKVLHDYFTTYRFTSIAQYLELDTTLDDGDLARLDELPRPVVNGAASASFRAPRTGSPSAAAEAACRLPVSVVVPCYNEETSIPSLANSLQSVQDKLGALYDFRFIFVDDGSADQTWRSLQRVFGAWPNARLVQHARNRGLTAAILSGIQAADTEIVCSIDCDCTYDPHEIGNMIPLLTEDVDLVTASPYHPEGGVRNVPGWRLALSRGASFLYRCVLRQKLYTYTSCFRVYRRRVVLAVPIRNMRFLGITEMMGKLDLRGSQFREHPAFLETRLLGYSKMKILRTIREHLGLLARLAGARLFNALSRLGKKLLRLPAIPAAVAVLEPPKCERPVR